MTPTFKDSSELNILNKYFDMFIVGSDQVWRKAITQNNLKTYFLNFVKDKKILVVDDVMTTGATLNACASLLKHYHCSAVYVSAIARNPLEKVDKK